MGFELELELELKLELNLDLKLCSLRFALASKHLTLVICTLATAYVIWPPTSYRTPKFITEKNIEPQ